MDSKNTLVTGVVVILVLSTPILVYSDNEGVGSMDASDPNSQRVADSPDQTEEETVDVALDPNKTPYQSSENSRATVGDARISELEAPAPQERRPNKLVAWWKLDEADGNDVADSSGNGCLGKLIGNPQWQPAGGKIGGALEFDGDGDYIEIGNESAFDIAGAMTVAAWIKVNRFDKRWQAIVTKGDTAWRIQRTATEDTLAFHCTGIVSIEGQSGLGIEGNKSVNDNKWHHVVGVYDGSTVSLYIDGALDNSGEASGSIHTNDSPVLIGANDEASDREWNGLIDEVCIIVGAIDANGVHALYSGADPMTVAQTATIARPARTAAAESEPQMGQVMDGGAERGIEGDWEAVSDTLDQKFVIEVRRRSDGTLAAIATGEDADGVSAILPFDEVSFENGKLRLVLKSSQGLFEGTMKEGGLTIEGEWRQQGQLRPLVLKRVERVRTMAGVRSGDRAIRTPEKQVESRTKLVAWWKFDDDTSDSAGPCHGTPHGGPTYGAGKSGKAISLDGDDYVDYGNPSSLNFGAGDWAVSAWINTTQFGTEDADKGTVFAKGGDGGGGIRYTLAVNEGQSGAITLSADDDLSKVQAISRAAVNDGAWHHVVGMRDRKQLRLYVDGALDTVSTLPAGFNLSGASQQNAYVGVIADNGDSSLIKYFVGLIDEVCVFACSLDASSVKALYSGRDPMTVAEQASTIAPTPLRGKSHTATAVILVLGLAGLIGAVVLFLVKSSITR
ncbi:MAG: LamG domain-containing protein [Phycisphaerales bacterium]|nr:MAG: LamG domain-containing protein [Phycisphaerales bacterium]